MRTALAFGLVALTLGCTESYSDDPTAFFGTPGEQAVVADPTRSGHALMNAGEYALALRAFQRAVALNGPTPEALVGMGSASGKLGRLPQAERYLRAAVEEAPASVVAWNNLGVVLQERDDYVGAAAAFRMAFALDSGDNDLIRQNLNSALLRQDRRDAVIGPEPANQLVPLGHGLYILGQSDG
ncbi:MAG: tetratricopeptide repeat protein [Pseudomonadota bacterium]